ncbi:translation initiation factor IF-2-like [Meles meles]|uniref:translation initiation factor IF-2-like n=1 Tax=Meles meles TaxID=9662 RepID=UPI001E69ECA3|nr:translation initiation factor IF-2-like [Meles meles]
MGINHLESSARTGGRTFSRALGPRGWAPNTAQAPSGETGERRSGERPTLPRPRAHGWRVRGRPTSRGARPTPRPGGRTRAGAALAPRSAEPAAGVPAPPGLGPPRRRRRQPGSAGAESLRADAEPRGRGGARGGAALETAENWGRRMGRGVVTPRWYNP